jgi:hypothetical protein
VTSASATFAMKVTFTDPSQYWKPDVKPEEYESLGEALIPRSELVVYAKTSGIDPECLDWWSPWNKEASRLLVVCLNDNGRIDPPVHYCDVLIIRSENGVDVIKGVDEIGISFHADVDFHAGLKEYGRYRIDDGSFEDAVTKIEFRKRLTDEDWRYYKDLMHRSDKALRLFHSYEGRESEERIEAKESLKPKLTWPIIATALFVVIQALDFFDGGFLQWLSYILLLPAINYVFRLIRYLTYKA